MTPKEQPAYLYMDVKAGDIGKFMKIIYEVLKNFTSEHSMSFYVILLLERGESIPKPKVTKKLHS